MEIDRPQRSELLSFAIQIATLMAITIGLATLMLLAAQAVHDTEEALMQKTLARLAWLAAALLGLTLVMLFWTAARWFRSRIHRLDAASPTPYVDAWALAGRRFKLPADEAVDDDDEEDEDEDEGEDDEGDEADGS